MQHEEWKAASVSHTPELSPSLAPRFRDENVYLSKKIYKQSLLPTGAKDFQPGGDLISEISLGLTKLSVKQSSAGCRARGAGKARERERGKEGEKRERRGWRALSERLEPRGY